MNTPSAGRHGPAEAAADHRIVLIATAAATVAIILYTSLQASLLGAWSPEGGVAAPTVAALVAPIAMLGAVHVLRPERYGRFARCGLVVVLALGAASTLVGVRSLADGLSPRIAATTVGLGEFAAAAVAAACAVGLGLVQVDIARRIRRAERGQSAAQARATGLVAELQEEELRLRYELAETIHGSVQGTFVVIETRLRHLAVGVRDRDRAEDTAAELTVIANQLERLREKELRALSARLYPVDLERGLAPAVRALIVRLPPSVAVRAPHDDVFTAVEQRLTLEARVLVVRVVEDALSNALRHGGADEIAIDAWEDADLFAVAVVNNGAPPSPDSPWSGLGRLRRRVEVLGGSLTLTAERYPPSPKAIAGGARLTLVLPLPTGNTGAGGPLGAST